MGSSRLVLTLPETEINFLKEYAKKEKTTVPKLIDKWIKSLRNQEDIHPEIKKFTGIIPNNVDIEDAVTEYLMEKHK